MAGRGRGKGKNISFNLESLGFGRGETLPTPILQPTPTYPIAAFKAVPLLKSAEQEYLVTLKQDLRNAMRDSPYYIRPLQKKNDIERYSDKYLGQSQNELWEPDWSRLPAELQPRKKRKVKSSIKPNIKPRKKVDFSEHIKVLEEKEKKGDEAAPEEEEEEGATVEQKKKVEDEEEAEEEIEYEESDLEEETDYNLTYFDNGDNDDEDGDLDEGPVY